MKTSYATILIADIAIMILVFVLCLLCAGCDVRVTLDSQSTHTEPQIPADAIQVPVTSNEIQEITRQIEQLHLFP